jgi:hypothetical protein
LDTLFAELFVQHEGLGELLFGGAVLSRCRHRPFLNSWLDDGGHGSSAGLLLLNYSKCSSDSVRGHGDSTGRSDCSFCGNVDMMANF